MPEHSFRMRTQIRFVGVGLHHQTCKDPSFFSSCFADAWSWVHALTSVSMSVEVRKQPLPLLSLPSSLTALSAWVLKCAQFGDQSLPRSLLLHCPWLCVHVWERVWETLWVCVCVCHSATCPTLCRLNRQSHYLLSVSVVRCQAPLTSFLHLLEGTHIHINLRWCSLDMTHLTFLSSLTFMHCWSR